jgi:hypothetical protein
LDQPAWFTTLIALQYDMKYGREDKKDGRKLSHNSSALAALEATIFS